MDKVRVRDGEGDRWTVRARRLRRGESSRPWPGPELESLRRRLGGVLAPRPLPLPPTWGTADASDIALSEVAAGFREAWDQGAWAAPGLVLDVVDHLRTPMSDAWQVEVMALGRIRRWARWEVDGPEATERVISTVAADVAAGRIPEPEGAVLVEVVDQRPPDFRRWSAGLGGVRPAG